MTLDEAIQEVVEAVENRCRWNAPLVPRDGESGSAIADLRNREARERRAIERLRSLAPGEARQEPVAWMVEYREESDLWTQSRPYNYEHEAEDAARRLRLDGYDTRIARLYREPPQQNEALAAIRAAAEAYEADPVDNRDRPSSWGKLRKLLDAIRDQG